MATSAPVAHLTLIHTSTPEARKKLISLNSSHASSLKSQDTTMTTRTLFTPATRPKAMLGMVPTPEVSTLLGLIEIYTSSKAVEEVKRTNEYRDFQSKVAEGLPGNEKGVETSEWTPAAGFFARGGESSKAGIVMLAKFVVRDGDVVGNVKGLVEVLGNFCDWVQSNEQGTLTYAVLTSRTHPNEVLMFERYTDLGALGVHGKSAEFKNMFKGTGKFLQGRKTVLSEWVEEEGSFVRSGSAAEGRAKL